MREIKFRVWDVENKIFLNPIDCTQLVIRPLSGKVTDGATTPNVELLQYTGLKDKNGVEIYEGDIDQAENGDKSVIVFLLKAGTYCVMPMDIYLNNDYQNESFFPDFIYGFGYDLFFDNCTPDKYLNIIGNIYENPELLEGNQ